MLPSVIVPARSRHCFTYTDYLAHEETSKERHKFLEGDIYAMARGTPEHAALAVAVSTILSNHLAGARCSVFSSDLRVRVLATGLATYPDVTVVCGPLQRDPDSRVTVTNPTLIVEIASDGTEEWDRGEKLEQYQQIPALRECMVVSHRAPRIDVWRRGPDDRWSHHEATAGQMLTLESIAASTGCRRCLSPGPPRHGVLTDLRWRTPWTSKKVQTLNLKWMTSPSRTT
jgi:Uma2 family endonuclease